MDAKLRDKMRERFLAIEGKSADCHARDAPAERVEPGRLSPQARRLSQAEASQASAADRTGPGRLSLQATRSHHVEGTTITQPSVPSGPASAQETGAEAKAKGPTGQGLLDCENEAEVVCVVSDVVADLVTVEVPEQGEGLSTFDELQYERQKALELARALARSEADKQQASAEIRRLQEEVRELRQQNSSSKVDRGSKVKLSPKAECSPPAQKQGLSFLWILAAVILLMAMAGGAFVRGRDAEQQLFAGAALGSPSPSVRPVSPSLPSPPRRKLEVPPPENLVQAESPLFQPPYLSNMNMPASENLMHRGLLSLQHQGDLEVAASEHLKPPILLPTVWDPDNVEVLPSSPPLDFVKRNVPAPTAPLFEGEDWPLSAVTMDESVQIDLLHPCLAQEPELQGDATEQFAQVLHHLSGLHQVYRLGLFVINTALYDRNPVLAQAALSLRNDGSRPWPNGTSLRCSLGSGFAVHSIDVLSEVPPGQSLEFNLNFKFHMAGGENGTRETSAWALVVDENPFGPLLLLDAVWVW